MGGFPFFGLINVASGFETEATKLPAHYISRSSIFKIIFFLSLFAFFDREQRMAHSFGAA